MSGWICMHRKLLKWEWYDDINTTRLFIHCLLRANHKPNKWQGIEIPAGSFVTGRKKLSAETGLSERAIRTCLDHLKATNEITIKTTNKNSLITVANWASYQIKEEDRPAERPAKRPANSPTSDQQPTTNNNDNNDNNQQKTKRFAKPSFDDLENYKKEKKLNLDSQAFLDYYDSKGWIVGKTPMKDWKATARGWSGRQSGFGNSQQPQQPSYEDFPAND